MAGLAALDPAPEISMTTNGDAALCLTFREPVPAIDPTATITHPGATLGVDDPRGLAEALGFSAS